MVELQWHVDANLNRLRYVIGLLAQAGRLPGSDRHASRALMSVGSSMEVGRYNYSM
jgi:hypothetical protein